MAGSVATDVQRDQETEALASPPVTLTANGLPSLPARYLTIEEGAPALCGITPMCLTIIA
jgi:hypothetical protein